MIACVLFLAAQASDFERCLALDGEFDTAGLVAPCSAAADDATLPVRNRVRALRSLGSAHLVNGANDLAERAFLRMLVLSAASALPSDAGAREVAAFSRARELFAKTGAVTRQRLDALRDGDALAVTLEVKDPLGRVLRAAAVIDGGSPVPLARRDLGLGLVAFEGRVPAAIDARGAAVILSGWDDAPVAAEPAAEVSLVDAPPPPAAAPPENGVLPLILIGSGSAGAVVGGAALAAMELTLADPDLPGADRPGRQMAGRVGLGLAGVSVLVAGAGAALFVIDLSRGQDHAEN